MSRIGKSPIKLPQVVTLERLKNNMIHVKGPKGALSQYIDPAITIIVKEGLVKLESASNQKTHKALHGLYRSLLNNMVIGVSEGFKKTLAIIGVGYKASVQNNVLELNLGYAHKTFFAFPPEVTVKTEMEKGKDPIVHLEGIDKQLVGQLAAKLKSLRKIEPYKGKGIKFLDEKIRHKVGKATSK